MKFFMKEELKTLTAKRPGPCVSLYMPTHRIPLEIQQDRLRLKNLLRGAEQSLLAKGLRPPEAKSLLKPGENLLSQTLFWKGQKDGLAMFLARDFFHYYPVPLDLPELAVVTDRFHVKPLLALLSDGEFFILAFSLNEVRLLQASRYSVSEIELEGVPRSLAQALEYDEPEKQLQFHTGAPKFTGDRAAMFHGHGVGSDDAKSNILRFCQQVDRGLFNLLKNEQAPLIFAGVDYLFPIFQEANSYPLLMERSVTGNPEGLRPEEMQEQAWAIVQPYFQQKQEEAKNRYRELGGTAKTSADIKEIAPAAYQGRVDLLFVAVGLQQWGVFDRGTHKVEVHSHLQSGDEDLLDFAAVHTLLQGGTVFSVKPVEVPDGAPAAAVFRY